MDEAELLGEMRAARFPDRWSEARTWTAGLLQWHGHTRPDAWHGVAGDSFQDESLAWVESLVSCALHHAGVRDIPLPPEGPMDPDAPLLATDLADAAALLGDARTAVDTITKSQIRGIRTARPLPDKLVQAHAKILASVPYQLENGNTEIKTRVIRFISMGHQVLQDHAELGRTVDDRLPDLAKAFAMSDALTQSSTQAPYARASTYTEHALAVVSLDEIFDQSELLGYPSEDGWLRGRLLQRAALTDRWLCLWGSDDQPQQRVDQARTMATTLLAWDTEHGSGTGSFGQYTLADDLAPYVREQYAVWLESINEPILN